MVEIWRDQLEATLLPRIGALWGKSGRSRGPQPDGEANLLLQHLFDALAVGELIWDRYLAPGLRARLDLIAGGDGRRMLAWLCSAHDLGKATPAFQSQDRDLGAAAQAAGLVGIFGVKGRAQSWRHELASALILRDRLKSEWSGEPNHLDWVWPLVAGHHGKFPATAAVERWRRRPIEGKTLHGDDQVWGEAQNALLACVTTAAGYVSVKDAEPAMVPSRADQLLLSGLIVMADWISSDEAHFPGISNLDSVGVEVARERAAASWAALGLDAGWVALAEPDDAALWGRFPLEPRPSQAMVIEAARSMTKPGLLIVEAPTGEGKTEASLAAAEILAARFGANGIYAGLPTQATSDPMFVRVQAWLSTFEPQPSVVLLHGKRRFNSLWKRLSAGRAPSHPTDEAEVTFDEMGLPVEEPPSVLINSVCEDCNGDSKDGAQAAAQWFLGHKRGLLAPNGVGTIDHVLFAGTCTRHVMLRYAGLAGKVVILDEVHAADVYMSQFLGEVLRWLGQGKVPVVLLSATLAPEQRRQLVRSYLQGAAGLLPAEIPVIEGGEGYPQALAVWHEGQHVQHLAVVGEPWRRDAMVKVSLLAEPANDSGAGGALTTLLRGELAAGGCALVVRNTVGRAQDTFDALSQEFAPGEVALLHSRFTASDRARKTNELVERLGHGERPHRLVVVATQIAEQSFDIDVDLLVSDLAPVDLLIQRAGRLHRHLRGAEARPPAVRSPHLVVTALEVGCSGPTLERGAEAIYGRHLLLQSAALVLEAAAGDGWLLPAHVPTLVAQCYGPDDLVPPEWAEDASTARCARAAEQAARRARAEGQLLAAYGETTKPTLEGLHDRAPTAEAEDVVRVRDGDMGAEVVLVCEDSTEGFSTLRGRRLGVNADDGPAAVEEILGDSVRLPATGRYTALSVAADRLGTLPAWRGHHLLGDINVLKLDDRRRGEIEGFTLHYDPQRGLSVEKAR